MRRGHNDWRSNFVCTVTAQGQLTIPMSLRRQLRLDPGSKLQVQARGGRIFLTPLQLRKGVS
jgi:AbrB family looped-hinge helix DNA binding protein